MLFFLNNGELFYKGNPVIAINEMRGKVWKKEIEKDQLKAFKLEFNVLFEKMYLGKPIIYIHSEENPGMGFQTAEPNLESFYFSKINGSKAVSNESVLIN